MRCSYIGFMFMMGCVPVGKTGSTFLDGVVPEVSFSHLEVQEIDFEHVDSSFVFVVDNPNPVGFSIDRFDYALDFSQVEWLSGDNPDGLTLNPDDESEVALPVSIVWTELYDVVQALRGNDTIDFGLNGNFGVRLASDTIIFSEQESAESQESSGSMSTSGLEQDSDGYVFELPYDVLGDFPALRRPEISFRKLKVVDYSLSELNLRLNLKVDNEHASNLLINRFAYDLKLGNADLISGVAENLNQTIVGASEEDEDSDFNAQANRILSLPININLQEAGAGLLTLLQSNSSPAIDLEGSIDLETPFGPATLSVDETGSVDVEF
ncbi:MAG: hypothetical protein CMK59_07550 [Proteobacteria bacterium]|nr:hypothetical protein [Pseudomonadota bacterium]